MLRSETASALLTGEFSIPGTGAGRLSAAEAALTRRSIRTYSDEPVSDDEIRLLLELTGRAPSAFNLQPWRFVVVRDQQVKDALKDVAYGQVQVGGAPVLLAMYADMEDTMSSFSEVLHPGLPDEKRDATLAMLNRNFGGMTPEARATWANAQANIALGYLLLIARSEGLDTSPMLGFDAARVKTILGLPEHAVVTALVAVGRGAEEGFSSHRHTVERVAIFK